MCALLRNRGIPSLVKGGFLFSSGITLFTLLLYSVGADYSDRTLFLLLGALRCFSLLTLVFALAALGFTIYCMTRQFRPVQILSLILYISAALAGALLLTVNVFIMAAAGGNG